MASAATSAAPSAASYASALGSLAPLAAIENYFKVNGDKRVAELRFMDNPWEVLFISAFYVYFCADLGPHRLMKNRKPFDLVWTVRGFNTLILLLNIWLLKRHFSLLNWGYDSLGCSPVSENDRSPKALEQINIFHIFLYSRILELVDTLWICLRKKNRQITFLHVFHHSFVLLMTWFYIKFAPGGSTAMFPIINGMVHTIMYLYYILSTFDNMKPYLWWKRYVTTIQLLQFIVLGLHFAVAAFTPNCGYPRALSLSGVGIACMFFALFAAFYKQTYTKPTGSAPASKHQQQVSSATSPAHHNSIHSNSNSNNNNLTHNNHNSTSTTATTKTQHTATSTTIMSNKSKKL